MFHIDIQIELFISMSMYKFESNTQHLHNGERGNICCLSVCQCTNLKAIHNTLCFLVLVWLVVYQYVNVQIWKQYTTSGFSLVGNVSLFISMSMYKFESNTQPSGRAIYYIKCCLSVCQCTNLKAIHNRSSIFQSTT